MNPVESPLVCDRVDDENRRSESNPVADEVGGARPRSQTSGDSTGMGSMGTGYRRIYVTLHKKSDPACFSGITLL